MTPQITADWTEIVTETWNARNAARQGQTFKTGETWSIIENGEARQASPDEAEAIEAHFAKMAAMMVEFNAGDFDLAEWTAPMPAFDAWSEIDCQAEAAAQWAADCRNGFTSF